MTAILPISTQQNLVVLPTVSEPESKLQDRRIVTIAGEETLRLVKTPSPEPRSLKNRAVMWTYTASTPSSYGGWLDTFELDTKYYSRLEDGSIESTPEALNMFFSLFPAIEPLATDIPFLSCQYEYTIFKRLGFKAIAKDEGVFITVPDPESLINGWEKLREEYPQFPKLKLALRKDIASNQVFIQDWMEKKITVSEEIEYLHDLINHVGPKILLITNPGYKQIQKDFSRCVRNDHETIVFGTRLLESREKAELSEEKFLAIQKHLPKIEFVLSAMIDSLSALTDMQRLRTLSEISSLVHRKLFIDYF